MRNKVVKLFTDGLRNVVSGIGTAKDKSANYTYLLSPMARDQIDAMYAHDWLARKIIDIPPNDMTREWREWEADKAEDLYEAERDLSIQSKVRDARRIARGWGGAAILIGNGDKDPEKPLDVEKFLQGGLKYLHVFPSFHLTPSMNRLIEDIEHPDYGKPEFFDIIRKAGSPTGNQLRIHRSRFAFFLGPTAPESYKQVATESGGVWGMTILDIVKQACVHCAAAAANAAALTEQANVDIITIPDLHQQLSDPEGEARLIQRFTLANTLKSTLNTLVLGGEETFTRAQISFGGLTDLIHTHLEIASGAADIPVTRLLGQTPAGLSSTGESDLRNYYDMLRSLQSTDMSEELRPLDEVLKRHVLGDYDKSKVTYEWKPLWAMTEEQKAAVDNQKATTTQVYVNSNLFAPEELRPAVIDQLVADGTYPTLDQHVMEEDEFKEILNSMEEVPPEEGGGQQGGPPQQGRPKLRVVEGDSQEAKHVVYLRCELDDDGEIVEADEITVPFADASWYEEHEHPRGSGGKWTSKATKALQSMRLPRAPEMPYWMRRNTPRKAEKAKTEAQQSPAVSLFDETVAKEGIPTAKELIEELPQVQQDALAQAEERMKGKTASYIQHTDKEGHYTPEREEVHKALLQKIFTTETVKAARPPEGQKPVAVFLGGRGGSGKTWVTGPDGPVDKSKFILINPDDFKEALPEYEGWNAGLLHEESDDIATKATAVARRMGLNVIHDATMKSGHKVRARVDEYKALGYDVDAYYVFASPKTAATRAVERFIKTGRYVPPAYSLASLTNEATFDAIISKVRDWKLYSSNEGFPTRLVSQKEHKAGDYDPFDEAFDALFEDTWKEEAHPRQPGGTGKGGEFAPKGSGGTGFTPTGPGAPEFVASKNVFQHKKRVAKVLQNPPAKFGHQYRDMVRLLAEEAKYLGLDEHVAPLKKKIGESFHMEGAAALSAGKITTANKLFGLAKQNGYQADPSKPGTSPLDKPETPPTATAGAPGGQPYAPWQALDPAEKNQAWQHYLSEHGGPEAVMEAAKGWNKLPETAKHNWYGASKVSAKAAEAVQKLTPEQNVYAVNQFKANPHPDDVGKSWQELHPAKKLAYYEQAKNAEEANAHKIKNPEFEAKHPRGPGGLFVEKADDWTKTGGQLGSNPGGVYVDPKGVDWYVKTPKTADHVKQDLLANRLYAAAGIAVALQKPVLLNGKPSTASKIITGATLGSVGSAKYKDAVASLRAGFVIDAWLGNRDVIGLEQDNVLVAVGGIPFRLDQGGTLEYRAQGEKKDKFGPDVTEFDSLRDPKLNPQSAAVFGSMTPEELKLSSQLLTNVSDEKIRELTKDADLPDSLADILIARKSDVIVQVSGLFPAAPKTVTPVDPAKLTEAQKKAMKSTPVPNSHSGSAAASALVEEFNKKYSGVTINSMEELDKKMSDYSTMQQKLQAIHLEELTKEQQALASEAEEEAKLSDPDVIKKNLETLGGIVGGSSSAASYTSAATSKLNKSKYKGVITPVEAALIHAYTGSFYGSVNKELRDSAVTPTNHAFAKALSVALKKLPAHQGTVYRKSDLPVDVAKNMKPGMIVIKRAFTSSSVNQGTWHGQYQFVIESKTGRYVQPLSMHPSEGEVLFDRDSDFRVTKREGYKIWLEEME